MKMRRLFVIILSYLCIIVIIIGVSVMFAKYQKRIFNEKQNQEFIEFEVTTDNEYVTMVEVREGEENPKIQPEKKYTEPEQKDEVQFKRILVKYKKEYLFGVYLLGQRGTIPVVGAVYKGSIAEMAGLQVGDEILLVNGKEADHLDLIDKLLGTKHGDPVTLMISRGDEMLIIEFTSAEMDYE